MSQTAVVNGRVREEEEEGGRSRCGWYEYSYDPRAINPDLVPVPSGTGPDPLDGLPVRPNVQYEDRIDRSDAGDVRLYVYRTSTQVAPPAPDKTHRLHVSLRALRFFEPSSFVTWG